ncbi:MAG TPA: PQQ-binding-like beta-propeller repeat protein [Opitutaceae bacterium]|nr:PQQ-binding-like beta-propeller repeat protein [Opitutaceae bacterium]
MKYVLPLVTALALVTSLSRANASNANPHRQSEWTEYLGGPDRNHYSTIDQIRPENVTKLQVAWTYHSGDFGQMQCNPIVVDGVLYGATASAEIFALDAATGLEKWRYSEGKGVPNRTIRGVTYWESGDDKRIIFALDANLCEIDARTGKLVASFGDNGKTSLRAGLGETAKDRYVVSTTPGTLFGDIIVMPFRVEENEQAALGTIQAFNVRTGKLVWTFRTIPLPGEYGYETWSKDTYKNINVGAANNWSGMSIDRKRGILYVPTGSAAPDFWGGNRIGQNLFANCLLALDAATGKRLWHFQFVHHDLWDRDLPAPPNLITIKRDGRTIDAVAQVTKLGYVYVFDRVTGEPLFPIEEKPFPKTELSGDEAWPTQPIPTKPAPYARQNFTEKDINPYSEEHDKLLKTFRESRTGTFVPFSKQYTIIFPGFDGGAEWGGAAADPDGILYVNETTMGWVARLTDTPTDEQLAELTPGHRVYVANCIGCHGPERKGNPTSGYPSLVDVGTRRSREEIAKIVSTGKGMMPAFTRLTPLEQQTVVEFLIGDEKKEGSANAAGGEQVKPKSAVPPPPYRFDGYVKFVDSKGFPGINPPWGTLNAIDLNTGEYLWKVTLGDFKEISSARGIPPTGAENYGGPVVTAGGVIFIAATKDGYFRAFDRKTGKLLWETKLPAPGFATPCTYETNGKQYVVVACGGTKLDTPKGDCFVAFALP